MRFVLRAFLIALLSHLASAQCTGSPPTPSFICSSGQWFLASDLVIQSGSTVIVNGSSIVEGNVVINGGSLLVYNALTVENSLYMPNGGLLLVGSGAGIYVFTDMQVSGTSSFEYQTSRVVVSNCANFSGSLVFWNHTTTDSTANAINYACFVGHYAAITVLPNSNCYSPTISNTQYSYNVLIVSIKVADNLDCNPIIPGMTREQALGLIIGLPLGTAAIVSCLAFFLIRRRRLEQEAKRLSKMSHEMRKMRTTPSSTTIMLAAGVGNFDRPQKPPSPYDRV